MMDLVKRDARIERKKFRPVGIYIAVHLFQGPGTGADFSPNLRFFAVNLHSTISPYSLITAPEVCGSPDQVAPYYIYIPPPIYKSAACIFGPSGWSLSEDVYVSYMCVCVCVCVLCVRARIPQFMFY
jgi:hypothetical protein